MRGYKIINFNEFKNLCSFRRLPAESNNFDRCFDDTQWEVCATNCRHWIKLGNKKFKIIKINNKKA